MQQGKRCLAVETLAQISDRTAAAVARLPDHTRQLDSPISPPVILSAALEQLTAQTHETTQTLTWKPTGF